MNIEAAFVTYATKHDADITLHVQIMEAGTLRTTVNEAGEEPRDTTGQTLGAYRAEVEALESIKVQVEAGKPG